MEREVGEGIGMGNTGKPMADSFQCMTKPTTIKKKKNGLKGKHLAFSEPSIHGHCGFAPHSQEDKCAPMAETVLDPKGFYSLASFP